MATQVQKRQLEEVITLNMNLGRIVVELQKLNIGGIRVFMPK